jgi:hypothetical protein
MAQSVRSRQPAPRLCLSHALGAVELALNIQSQLARSS